MEKLIYKPTGVSVEVDSAIVEKMLKSGFVRATSTPAAPQSKPAAKKVGKNESKNTKKL